MLPGVFANPEDIRRFASELRLFNGQLAESMTRLQGQFASLGDTWRDQEHEKFAHEFEATARLLRAFRNSSEQQIPLLIRKAERLESYLGR